MEMIKWKRLMWCVVMIVVVFSTAGIVQSCTSDRVDTVIESK